MPKKLIEVALPLTQINVATATEKRTTARLAHPAKIHQWWARRPLVAARAILFAQLVDDPSSDPLRFPNPSSVAKERERLFRVLEGLLEINGPTDDAMRAAREEIQRCVGPDLMISDPFAGGGTIPLEAQRLGLGVDASDLNPVAVIINNLLLNSCRVAWNHPSVHPHTARLAQDSSGVKYFGIAEDLKWYGERLKRLALDELQDCYPTTKESEWGTLPIVAWIWAREIRCSNPACGAEVPLVSNLWLSKKKGRSTWLEPRVDSVERRVYFDVCSGNGNPRGKANKVGRGPNFECYVCKQPMAEDYTHEQLDQGRFAYRQLATVVKGQGRRHYLPSDERIPPSHSTIPSDLVAPCRGTFASNAQGRRYGFRSFSDYFMPRQLKVLSTMADLLPQVVDEVRSDSGDDEEYAALLGVLLALCVSKATETSNALSRWLVKDEVPVALFARQAISMVWDFAEANIMGESSGSWTMIVSNVARSFSGNLVAFSRTGEVVVSQANATTREFSQDVVVSTDPPYFDNISYADLSDFFYVWLRHMLGSKVEGHFDTMLSPKSEELVALPHRFEGSRTAANEHFEEGFRSVFGNIAKMHHPGIPMTIFYAYKQEDDEDGADGGIDGGSSGAGATGWEKLLQGIVDAHLQITATWPIRTEMGNRMVGQGTNSLASSVVLVCRARSVDAGIADRQGFIRHLRRDLSEKLTELQSGGVQPVDMAQASIGPGMAVFTSYAKVLEGGDRQMSVGAALQIINQVLDELQSEQESEFDSDTRWAVTWFAQNGMNSGEFGDAQNIATARGTAVNALEKSGIVEARAGRVRLLARSEYADDWDPTTDNRLTVWEVCQHLIRRIEGDGGLMAAAALLRQVGGLGEAARDLAYRLYEIANRNGWSEEARANNNLAAEWPDLVALAAQAPTDPSTLF